MIHGEPVSTIQKDLKRYEKILTKEYIEKQGNIQL